jgi:thymidylate synthase
MLQYLSVLGNIAKNGVQQPNRTGVDTLMIPGAMMQFDLADGFPLITTRDVPFKPIVAELIGFCRGLTNAADFRKLGAKIWDKNANEDGINLKGEVVPNAWLKNPNRKGTDDLGRIYGAQWRDWKSSPVFEPYRDFATNQECEDEGDLVERPSIDQQYTAMQQIKTNPTSRRILVNAWRPDEFDQMALPPCHVLHQYLVDTVHKKLHMTMYQRSHNERLH